MSYLNAPATRGVGADGRGQGDEELRWLGIQGRHLVTLLTVAREGTFAKAAAKLGYTQSTISHQVATLERLVGERLIDRGPGAGVVRLTSAGELMLEHANAIMSRLGAARADLASAREDGPSGTLRIGLFQSVGTSLLPRIVAGLGREFPDVVLQLLECDPRSKLQNLVARGEIDLAFTLGPLRHDSLQHVVILREPFVLLLPPEGRTRRSAGTIDRLAAPSPCPVQERVEQALHEQGVRPRDIVRVDDVTVIEAIVASGSVVGLVPRSPLGHGSLGVVELDPSLARTVIACWHGDRVLSAPARRAVELARSIASTLDGGASSSKPSEVKP